MNSLDHKNESEPDTNAVQGRRVDICRLSSVRWKSHFHCFVFSVWPTRLTGFSPCCSGAMHGGEVTGLEERRWEGLEQGHTERKCSVWCDSSGLEPTAGKTPLASFT